MGKIIEHHLGSKKYVPAKISALSLGSETKMVAQNPSIGIMYRVYGVYHVYCLIRIYVATAQLILNAVRFFLKGKEVICDWKVYQFSVKTGGTESSILKLNSCQ